MRARVCGGFRHLCTCTTGAGTGDLSWAKGEGQARIGHVNVWRAGVVCHKSHSFEISLALASHATTRLSLQSPGVRDVWYRVLSLCSCEYLSKRLLGDLGGAIPPPVRAPTIPVFAQQHVSPGYIPHLSSDRSLRRRPGLVARLTRTRWHKPPLTPGHSPHLSPLPLPLRLPPSLTHLRPLPPLMSTAPPCHLPNRAGLHAPWCATPTESMYRHTRLSSAHRLLFDIARIFVSPVMTSRGSLHCFRARFPFIR